MKQKLLVVALDGATWDVAEPLIAAGRMPSLAALLQEGPSGRLLSTVPPVTPPAFASMFTGVEPARHGVFDFFGHAPADFRRRPPISTRDLRAPTVWSLLAAAGLRVGLVYMPMTWPPDPALRFVVSSQPGATGVHPESLRDELQRTAGKDHLRPARRRPRQERTAAMAAAESTRHKTILHLAGTQEWDLLAVCVKATDAIAHCAWPSVPSAPQVGALAAAYEQADRLLGELRRRAPQARVLVVSDHGHGPCTATFGLNQWLLRHGWLVLRPAFRPSLHSIALYRLLRAGSRNGWDHFLRMVDWRRSRAYGGTSTEQGVYLNLAGREPGGVVRPGREARKLAAEIASALEKLTLPAELAERMRPSERESGVRATPMDQTRGPYAHLGPEIALSLWGGAVIAREGLRPGPLFKAAADGSGTHRPLGLFALGGDGMRRYRESGDVVARIEDVAATILNLCGYAAPSEWSGCSLLAGPHKRGEETSWKQLRPLPRLSSATPAMAPGPESAAGLEERAAVKQALRDWGYLDDE